jgi:hypothetical protein
LIQGLLFLLPAIALLAPLLLRRYPGERVVLRLSGQSIDVPRRKQVATPIRHVDALLAHAHGGLLIARSLAVRPPPVTLLAS